MFSALPLCDLIQPGTKIETIFRDAKVIGGWHATENCLSICDISRGSGLCDHGKSTLHAGDFTELKSGIALAVRTRQPAGRLGTAHYGDTVLVKENGAEVLTR